ncbi:MAG: hypothetical protein AB7F86_13050 [Bdellovibrionales bacterium]
MGIKKGRKEQGLLSPYFQIIVGSLLTVGLGFGCWRLQHSIEIADQKQNQLDQERRSNDEIERREREQEQKDRKTEDEKTWKAIDNRLDLVFQFVKIHDKYQEKQLPKDDGRSSRAKFIFQVQKKRHTPIWRKAFAGQAESLENSADATQWSSRMRTHELIEGSHKNFKPWVVGQVWQQLEKEYGAQAFTIKLGRVHDGYTMACSDCDDLHNPSASLNSDTTIRGLILTELPPILTFSYYPYYNLQERYIEELLGSKLPEGTRGYFIPDAKHVQMMMPRK